MLENPEAYRLLWYGLVYAVVIIAAWFAVTVALVLLRLLRRPPVAPSRAKPESLDLANDPDLHRFFARVNHAYRRPGVPLHAKAPAPSVPLNKPGYQLVRVRPDPEVIAEVPMPEVVRTMPDPAVLHSAPFHSPRPTREPKLSIDLTPVLDSRSSSGPAPETSADPTDQALIALMSIWAKLGEKDRRELVALARIKAGHDQ